MTQRALRGREPHRLLHVETTWATRPDFQLCSLGILIEYFGRLDDAAYAKGMARKDEVYAANGISAITITPYEFRGNWPNEILDRIEAISVQRLENVRTARHGRFSEGCDPAG